MEGMELEIRFRVIVNQDELLKCTRSNNPKQAIQEYLAEQKWSSLDILSMIKGYV